jgi:hypothetical protein
VAAERPIIPNGVVVTVGGTQRALTLHEPTEPRHHEAMATPCVSLALGGEHVALTPEAAKSLAYRLLLTAGVDSPAARVNAPYPRPLTDEQVREHALRALVRTVRSVDVDQAVLELTPFNHSVLDMRAAQLLERIQQESSATVPHGGES